MEPAGRSIRRLDQDRQSGHESHRTLQMARVPSGGMILLSENGVTRFNHREDSGEFAQAHRDKARGLVALPNGDYVISYAPYPGYAHAEYALHRFSPNGDHISSWHPVFGHDDWRIVGEFTGGPLAVTGDGDLLFSDATQFQITKYLRGMPDSSYVVVSDGNIVPATAIAEAILPDGWLINWTRSLFVDEMEDGCILGVVREVSREGRGGVVRNLWVVVHPEGRIIGRSRFDTNYWYVNRGDRPGRYVVLDSDGVAELKVSVEPGSCNVA